MRADLTRRADWLMKLDGIRLNIRSAVLWTFGTLSYSKILTDDGVVRILHRRRGDQGWTAVLQTWQLSPDVKVTVTSFRKGPV